MSNTLYALLIGVDFYFPGQLPDGSYYPNLDGCVRDVERVEAFLKERLGLTEDRMLKLTITQDAGGSPIEPPARWPTYENMVASFTQLTALAAAGDQVYIHYSGHGGRATTLFPTLKGPKGIDETLVPTNIHHSQARHLRDVELAHLVQIMVEKGLLVTLVLDSCHAGGAVRGLGGARVRGIAATDRRVPPVESAVASITDLIATWEAAAGPHSRNLKTGSGWLIEPRGYTLLAACRGNELANEFPFDGYDYQGALTYWLLDALRQLGPGLTYKMLHERILAKIHSQFEQQTPQLQGERDRVVFGSTQVQPYFATTVLDVESGRIRLETGQVYGLRKGAQFAIYPPGANITDSTQRLALAELTTLGATESWAIIHHQQRATPIEQGAQAVVLDTANINLQRSVRFAPRLDLPPAIDQTTALAKAEQALQQSGSNFAHLAAPGDPVAFQVVVNSQGDYELWDAADSAIPNLRPALAIADPTAPAKLAQRLIHLAKYRNVQELTNFDAMSPLARALVIEIAGKQSAAYDPADPPNPQPFDPTDKEGALKPDEWVFIRIRNLLPAIATPAQPWLNALNLTLLNLQPDWGISQVYPGDPATAFLPLDAGGELLLPLQAGLPNGYTHTTDIIKAFATLGPTNFRWLELPALDQPILPKSALRSALGDSLESLLAAIIETEPHTRQLNPALSPSKGWVTAQVEVRVVG